MNVIKSIVAFPINSISFTAAVVNRHHQLRSQFLQHVVLPVFAIQTRTRTQTRIRGLPRQPLPGRKTPKPCIYNFQVIYPPDGEYTIMPLKIKKLGGRDPETGRVVVTTLGGGNKKYFRWVDHIRQPNPDGTPIEEKVFKIRYDPIRSANIALVAGGKLIAIQKLSRD